MHFIDFVLLGALAALFIGSIAFWRSRSKKGCCGGCAGCTSQCGGCAQPKKK